MIKVRLTRAREVLEALNCVASFEVEVALFRAQFQGVEAGCLTWVTQARLTREAFVSWLSVKSEALGYSGLLRATRSGPKV